MELLRIQRFCGRWKGSAIFSFLALLNGGETGGGWRSPTAETCIFDVKSNQAWRESPCPLPSLVSHIPFNTNRYTLTPRIVACEHTLTDTATYVAFLHRNWACSSKAAMSLPMVSSTAYRVKAAPTIPAVSRPVSHNRIPYGGDYTPSAQTCRCTTSTTYQSTRIQWESR